MILKMEEFFRTNAYGSLVQKVLYTLAVIAVLFLLLSILQKAYRKLAKKYGKDKEVSTVILLLDKVLKALLVFIALITILDAMGINTNSLLATAGIGTLVIGLGAQSLVKDFINGFFILTEKQYVVGEYIRVGSLEGRVEDVGLRMTKLRAYNGEVQFVPNGMMNGVVNTSRGPMRALATVQISYREDLKKVAEIFERLAEKISEEKADILEEPVRFLGFSRMNTWSTEGLFRAMTKPGEQWGMERYIIARAIETMKEENIPFPEGVKEKTDAAL